MCVNSVVTQQRQLTDGMSKQSTQKACSASSKITGQQGKDSRHWVYTRDY
jgi:hypothetical protein